MAVVFANGVQETTSTTGTGTVSLAGAVSNFQTFVAGIGSGNEVHYRIAGGGQWEIGTGTVTSSSPDTLSRDTVLESSNSNSLVSFSAGSKTVTAVAPASFYTTAAPFVAGGTDQFFKPSGNHLWVEMGSYDYSTPSQPSKRFNFDLTGLPASLDSAYMINMIGYAYEAAKAINVLFVGYNYPATSEIIKDQNVDLANSGLTFGTTRTSTKCYVWIESASYFFNVSLRGMRVAPFYSFNPSAGFGVTLTDVGVAVT